MLVALAACLLPAAERSDSPRAAAPLLPARRSSGAGRTMRGEERGDEEEHRERQEGNSTPLSRSTRAHRSPSRCSAPQRCRSTALVDLSMAGGLTDAQVRNPLADGAARGRSSAVRNASGADRSSATPPSAARSLSPRRTELCCGCLIAFSAAVAHVLAISRCYATLHQRMEAVNQRDWQLRTRLDCWPWMRSKRLASVGRNGAWSVQLSCSCATRLSSSPL